MPEQDLGNSGYYIVTAGKSVFIMANTDLGLQNGINEFMYITVGRETFSADTVVYNCDSRMVLNPLEIVRVADIDMVLPCNRLDNDETVHAMGMMTKSDVFALTDDPNLYEKPEDMKFAGYYWHNSFKYLPYETYQVDHPSWYSTSASPNSEGKYIPFQICYTARGDETEYRLMLQTVYAKMKEYLIQNPQATTITFTIQDNEEICHCPACEAKLNEYGSNSAAVINFTNDLADMLKADYPKVRLLFFAYNRTEATPNKVDGYTTCRDNVAVYFAPIKADYTKSFYDDANKVWADQVKEWAKFSKNIYLWLYNTNFDYYLFPYNSFETMADTNQFCKENNIKFLYWEGQWDQPASTGFSVLKEYMNAKLAWNTSYTSEELYSKFFPAYFGEASGTMRTFFNELVAYMNAHPSTGTINEPIGSAEIWDKATLEKWLGYINTAYSQVDENSVYYKHIKLESIFVRHALMALYNVQDANFEADCRELGVWYYSECSHGPYGYNCGYVSDDNAAIIW